MPDAEAVAAAIISYDNATKLQKDAVKRLTEYRKVIARAAGDFETWRLQQSQDIRYDGAFTCGDGTRSEAPITAWPTLEQIAGALRDRATAKMQLAQARKDLGGQGMDPNDWR